MGVLMPFNHRADIGGRGIPCAARELLWQLQTRRLSSATAQSAILWGAVSRIEGWTLGSRVRTDLGGLLLRLTVGSMTQFGPLKRRNGAERISEANLMVSE